MHAQKAQITIRFIIDFDKCGGRYLLRSGKSKLQLLRLFRIFMQLCV